MGQSCMAVIMAWWYSLLLVVHVLFLIDRIEDGLLGLQGGNVTEGSDGITGRPLRATSQDGPAGLSVRAHCPVLSCCWCLLEGDAAECLVNVVWSQGKL